MKRISKLKTTLLLAFLSMMVFAGHAMGQDTVTQFQNGDVIDANQVNANFANLLNRLVPVGAVIPWHKSPISGSVTLPEQWVECNGQVLDDPDSPFNGLTIPDLNSAGLFVRGGTSSGQYQDDQIQSHNHVDHGHAHGVRQESGVSPGGGGGFGTSGGVHRYTANTTNGHANISEPRGARHGSETRPKNMSMVWIIRVK